MKRFLFLFGVFVCSFCCVRAASVKYNIEVAQDGTGDYQTIQAAINATKAFPDRRIVIHIHAGIYHEKVRIYSWNNKLTLKGDGPEQTKIIWDDSFNRINKGRNSTFLTYTLKVESNDFIADGLSIENTAGQVGQAVALHVEGDRCEFINCKILGNQDTLYAAGEGCRQYYKNCLISGTTDFIFGEATAVFDSCEIRSLANSYVTAASTAEGRPYGFVFINCRLTATNQVGSVYLGRPWRDYAKVVYIHCQLESHILKEGWANWSGTERTKTAFFAEYKSSGKGASTNDRVSWSHQLTSNEADQYTLKEIFAASSVRSTGTDDWLPFNCTDK